MEFTRYALVALVLCSACGGSTSHAEVEVEAGAPCTATSNCTGGLVCGWSNRDRPNCGQPGVCVKKGCLGDGGVCAWFGFPICGCNGQRVELLVMTSQATPSGGSTTQVDYVSAPISDGHCYADAGESSH